MRKYLIEHLSSLQSRLARFACAIALLGAASVGCGAVTEQELTLAEQTLHYDLKLNLSIPPMFQGLKVTCSNGFIQCSALPGLLGLNTSYQVIGLCDDKTMLCAGDIKLLVLFAIDFSKDTAFTSGFAQSNADNMRDVQLFYTAQNGVDIDITTSKIEYNEYGDGALDHWIGVSFFRDDLTTDPDGNSGSAIACGRIEVPSA